MGKLYAITVERYDNYTCVIEVTSKNAKRYKYIDLEDVIYDLDAEYDPEVNDDVNDVVDYIIQQLPEHGYKAKYATDSHITLL